MPLLRWTARAQASQPIVADTERAFFKPNSFTRASSGVMVAHLMPTPYFCRLAIRWLAQ